MVNCYEVQGQETKEHWKTFKNIQDRKLHTHTHGAPDSVSFNKTEKRYKTDTQSSLIRNQQESNGINV